jgi:hypothetical protein
VTRLVLIASVIISIVIMGLFLGGDAQAGMRTVGDASPPFSSSTVRVTETLTPTYYTYLPLARRNSPPVIQVPEGEYLLVEYWTHHVLGLNCQTLCIDFPTYDFDPQSGGLTVYTVHPSDPALVLEDEDVGYLGRGTSLGGVGCGASSGLTKVEQFPLCKDDVTLRYVDEGGVVTLDHRCEVIVLEPGEAWVSDEAVESWASLGPGCVVTTTHYITNYGFQDRDKIVFSPH